MGNLDPVLRLPQYQKAPDRSQEMNGEFKESRFRYGVSTPPLESLGKKPPTAVGGVSLLSELFVNLSAGWFGAVFIVPMTLPKKARRANIGLLTVNLGFGITSLLFAYMLRKSIS